MLRCVAVVKEFTSRLKLRLTRCHCTNPQQQRKYPLKTLKCILSRQHKSVERASVIFHCGDFFFCCRGSTSAMHSAIKEHKESQVAFLLKQFKKGNIFSASTKTATTQKSLLRPRIVICDKESRG
jgi:hypothetical protein